MVAEKMKLKILATVSSELASHIDLIFQELSQQRQRTYSLENLIKYYVSQEGKSPDLVTSKRITSDVITVKREISFIYYVLNCPFYANYGINEHMSKDNVAKLAEALNTRKPQIPDYILSAKHHYKFYRQFRELIDRHVKYNQQL